MPCFCTCRPPVPRAPGPCSNEGLERGYSMLRINVAIATTGRPAAPPLSPFQSLKTVTTVTTVTRGLGGSPRRHGAGGPPAATCSWRLLCASRACHAAAARRRGCRRPGHGCGVFSSTATQKGSAGEQRGTRVQIQARRSGCSKPLPDTPPGNRSWIEHSLWPQPLLDPLCLGAL